MYIQGTQFLMIFSRSGTRELRASVRSVRLSQFGHFMMGETRIRGIRIGLSGAYGADGLPVDMDPDMYPDRAALWENLVAVPADLAEKFWKGGGHNSAGSEGPAMRQWARGNLKALRKGA